MLRSRSRLRRNYGVGGFLIEAGSAAPLAERVSWAIDNRAQLPAMGERGRERATAYYAAERNYPQLLDTLAEVVQKPVLAGARPIAHRLLVCAKCAFTEPTRLGQDDAGPRRRHLSFPANFTLIAAMNPCPCGYYGDPRRACSCAPGAIGRYQKR